MDDKPDIAHLWEEARAYGQSGDAYQEIKLLKLIVRHDPAQARAFLRLGRIYKQRQEWKPALHFLKKGLALQPEDHEAWWDAGIAFTALDKKRLARAIWNKFGWPADNQYTGGLISIRARWGAGYEILWGRRTSPALALIGSVPWPDSKLGFRDLVLVDGQPSGWQVVGRRKYPVFDELGLKKRSDYITWSCWLSTSSEKHLQLLERLCREAGMGFENWSNASLQTQIQRAGSLPEFFGPAAHGGNGGDSGARVALAARDQDEVQQTLTAWSIITFEDYQDLQAHL